jgi:hypothetical protein
MLPIELKDGSYQWKRDGKVQYCPRSDEGATCGAWCPAFIHSYDADGKLRIVLNCFPQKLFFYE